MTLQPSVSAGLLVRVGGDEALPVARSWHALGEADEDEDFADTGVNHKDGGLVTGEVEGDGGVVLLGARILGNQGVNVFRQAGDDRVLEDLDSGDLGQLKRRLSLAFESDNINGGTTELEEVLTSRYIARVEVEDVGVDVSQRLLSLTGGGMKLAPRAMLSNSSARAICLASPPCLN